MSNQADIKDNALLRKAAGSPPENVAVIIGGTRISEKIRSVSGFLDRAKKILIGGSTAFTFLAAQGKDVGNSKVEADYFDECRDILKKANEKNVKIVLPIDHIAAIQVEPEVTIKMIKETEHIPDNMMGLDIGFDTIELFSTEIEKAEVIVWYGPLGVYKIDTFSAGTSKIAEAVAGSNAVSVIIGEELADAVRRAGVAEMFSYITTESKAVLDFLTGNK
jgi:3-phosphoglycerate kinase